MFCGCNDSAEKPQGSPIASICCGNSEPKRPDSTLRYKPMDTDMLIRAQPTDRSVKNNAWGNLVGACLLCNEERIPNIEFGLENLIGGPMPKAKRGGVWQIDFGMAAKVRPALVLGCDVGDEDRVLAAVSVPPTLAMRSSRSPHEPPGPQRSRSRLSEVNRGYPRLSEPSRILCFFSSPSVRAHYPQNMAKFEHLKHR